MADALIGATGFVGGTLLRQRRFEGLYNSSNVHQMEGRKFGAIFCAGAPAKKWLANKEPEKDLANMKSLMGRLGKVECEKFVLVSTVDVFKDSLEVDENTAPQEEGLHPYGLHRLMLERRVQELFEDHLIVRLPGLVGPGLVKNVIYDFLNNNNLHMIDRRGVFQFYPTVNLWWDIKTAMDAGLKLLHLAAEPVSVAQVARDGFNMDFDNELENPPARYDMRSVHAGLYGASGSYQYDRRHTMLAVRAYAQSEQAAGREGQGGR